MNQLFYQCYAIYLTMNMTQIDIIIKTLVFMYQTIIFDNV